MGSKEVVTRFYRTATLTGYFIQNAGIGHRIRNLRLESVTLYQLSQSSRERKSYVKKIKDDNCGIQTYYIT